MKLNAPKNVNYAATVVRVRHITELAGCDNVVGVPVLGYQAIVSKDTQVGDLGIVFTAETQLSSEFAHWNNLYRHTDLNYDPSAKGYLEDNRRVKALKFRGHRSDALFLPLHSLAYLGFGAEDFSEGDTFDEINGKKICQKYYVRQPHERSGVQVARSHRKPRVDEAMMPRHFDTANYFRNTAAIGDRDWVTITQKLHGTSVRVAHTLVDRQLTWLERIARRLGVKVQDREWAYVYGSRNTIKDPDNPNDAGEWFGTDLYTTVGSRLKGLLPKGTVVYGEIVGWVPETSTPIQKGYTYRIPEGTARLFVYRITTLNEDGRTVDLSWPAVKEFCTANGLETVPELYAGSGVDEGWVTDVFLDQKLASTWPASPALPTDGNTVDEGVCLRVEGTMPTIVKAKSPKFFEYETKQLDKGVQDMETVDA